MSYEGSDRVHGKIILPDYVTELVATPQFQRLKKLQQLGKF